MTKIAIINPNSTQAMTDKCAQIAQQHKNAATEIWASNPTTTPLSIEGQYDEAMSVSGLLAEVQKAKTWGAEGLVVACFDDPGIGACRELLDGPVIGICEGAMKAASMVAKSFTVVTTLPRAVPLIEELADKYGMSKFCKKVRAADIPVLDLERDGDAAFKKLQDEIQLAVQQDECEAIILGCAGMTDLTLQLTDSCKIPVIDGVLVSFKFIEALIGASICTSKINAYALPRFNK